MKIVRISPFYLKHSEIVYECDSWPTAYDWWSHYHVKGYTSSMILDEWDGVIDSFRLSQKIYKMNVTYPLPYHPSLVNLLSGTFKAKQIVSQLETKYQGKK